MEEIKKKNKKLKVIAVILFVVIILLGIFDIYLCKERRFDVSVARIESNIVSKRFCNDQIMMYIDEQKGKSVKTLLKIAIAINQSNKSESLPISITGLGYENEIININEIVKKIESDLKYEVIMCPNEEGLVSEIFIRKAGEPKTEEILELEKVQDEWMREELKEKKRYEEYNETLAKYAQMGVNEEKWQKIIIVIIAIFAIMLLVLIIKVFITLRTDDENKKRKVLIAFITTESIITGALLLMLIGIMTGIIYNF